MTASLTALLVGLASLSQVAAAPVYPAPTVLEAAPPDSEYIEITRTGQPIAPAAYHAPANPRPNYLPTQPIATTALRPPVVARTVAQSAPADYAPSLSNPSLSAPPNAVPFAPNQGVPTSQSLFTNGYAGTRAYAVRHAGGQCGGAAPFQPISSLGPAPVMVQPVSMLPPNTYTGRGIIGQPKLYVQQQPVRNFFRWLSP